MMRAMTLSPPIGLILGACLMTACGSAMAAEGAAKSWRFDVLLDEKPIGIHEFVMRPSEAGRVVEIEASFDVRFLRIPLYSYRHRNTEKWSDGCLQSLDSNTDDNGDRSTVKARRHGDQMDIETDHGSTRVSGCVRSFAYWDRDFLNSESLLNAQTGELVPVSIEPMEATFDDFPFDSGSLDAYRITSGEKSIHIELAYTRNGGRWVYLESRLDNGRTLRYLPRGAGDFTDTTPDNAGSES